MTSQPITGVVHILETILIVDFVEWIFLDGSGKLRKEI
jgi:hypothetical protein